VLISAAVLWALAYFMERPASERMAPAPIEARFIEQSVPAAPQRVEAAPPVARRPKPPPPPRNERVEQKQPIQKAEPKPEAAPSAPVALPAAPSEEESKAGIDQAGTIGGPASSGGARGAPGPAFGASGGQAGSGGGGSMYANSGARAIVRPMPQIPNELREEAFTSTALARFHVAADGSAKVELARPTPDPRLNHILLESLMKWRFMPAIRDGKPVATTEEIVIKIEVK
jgi:protein TonB